MVFAATDIVWHLEYDNTFALREAKVDFPILESGFSKHACFCLSFIQLSFSLLCSCVYYFAFQVAIQWVSYTNIAVVITD